MYFLGDLEGDRGGLRGRGDVVEFLWKQREQKIKNVVYIFSSVVHENKAASVLPSPEACAAPCHLFLCSQQVKAPANSAV